MKRYKFSLSLLMFLILLVSCQSEGLNVDEQRNNETNIKTFLISMPKQSIVQTSDSEGAKKLIDFETLKIFTFNNGDGKYIKTVTPNKSDKITYDNEVKGYRIPINFTGFAKGSKIDMVLIANGDKIADPEQDQTKSDYCEKLTFDLNGKWDPNKKIPFWGEYKNFDPNGFDGTKFGKEIKISLLRSLAQISFQVNKETKNKISLQNVYVYNSLNKACLVPKSSNLNENESEFAVKAPTVADGAGINVDPQSNCLSYLKKEGVTDSSVLDLIYVPEQKAEKKDNLFLIIAAKYGDSPDNSYYRINLKNKDNKGAPFDILRNHNYVVKIKSVTGPGFETQEGALKAGPSNIDVEIVEWDNDISIGYIWGDKNFGVNTSKLVFESKSGLTKKIKYQTNLTEDQIKKELKYSLGDEGKKYFKISVDYDKNELIVTTINENNGATDFKGTLSLYREDPKKAFTIELVQKTPNLDYSINCDSTKVNGVYKEDSLLGDNNYIEVIVNSHLNLKDRFYEIKTNKVGGISFESHGTFPEFEKDKSGKGFHTTIKLKGTGTPISRAPKDLLISYNSINLRSCNVTVKMAYSPKKIMGVSWDYRPDYPKGYEPRSNSAGFAMQSGLSKLFLDSKDNFGMKNESVVKIEGIEYKYVQIADFYTLGNESHYHAKPEDTAEADKTLKNAIDNFKPDIIVWGLPSYITEKGSRMLAGFVKAGGCLILMSENFYSFARFFREITYRDGHTVHVGYNEVVNHNEYPQGGHGLCYRFLNLPSDPVLNGPFGNVDNKVWGEDKGWTKALTNFPENDMIVYSNSKPEGIEKIYLTKDTKFVNRGVTSFRHAKHNLIFVADGGFIGGTQDKKGYDNRTELPFMINVKPTDGANPNQPTYPNIPMYRPLDKENYGGNLTPGNKVCNSYFFGNALAYMIDRAEFHGINTGVK